MALKTGRFHFCAVGGLRNRALRLRVNFGQVGRSEMESSRQFLLFFVVGVLTTVVDFAVFNLLTGRRLRWRRIPANVVSVTIAMVWSFLANWFLVFQPDGHAWLERAGRFLATTAFSAFFLQSLILYLTTYTWTLPTTLALALVRRLWPGHQWTEDMISRNICKVMAVSAGLVWNFFWYKFFVYVN
jgi:putative flippase GtrA